MESAGARALWMMLLLMIPVSSLAEMVKDLYAAEVPVADQGAKALSRASGDALADVVVKVSGSIDVLQNPVIVKALPGARAQVQQYAYRRADGPDQQLTVRVEFDGSYVPRLVSQANAPLWTANRPLVLVWLVVEDSGGRYFVNWDSAPELSRQLLAEFARRGVPVQLPLYDLADSGAISTEEVWRLYAPALQGASARYDVQEILAGRLVSLTTGGAAGDWSFFEDNERIDRSITSPDPETFIRSGVAIVAERMAARYSVAPSGGAAGGISMSVTGVTAYSDYAGVVAWLEGLELIEHANVESIEGDTLALRLHAQADAGQLATIIELNERLVPQAVGGSDAASQLNYEWRN